MNWLDILRRLIGLPAPTVEPAPVPVPKPSPSPPIDPDAIALAMVAAHNAERRRLGLPLLALDATLTAAARSHAAWMARARVLSHQDGSNRWPTGRLRALGWTAPAAENIAEGTATPITTVDAWMASQGHRDNILGPWRWLGAARAVAADGRNYWCAVYG